MGVLDLKRNKVIKDVIAFINDIPQLNEEWRNYLSSSQSDIDMQLFGEELFAYILKRVVSSFEHPKKEQLDTVRNIYNSFCYDNKDRIQVGMFKQMLQVYIESPDIVTDKFDSIVACFENKEVALNYFKHLHNQGYSSNIENIKLMQDFLPTSRMYYLDERALYSAALNLSKEITPFVIKNASPDDIKQLVKKANNNAKKQSGLFPDLDSDLLAEVDDKLNGVDDLRENLERTILTAKEETKKLKEIVSDTKDEMSKKRISEIDRLEREVKSIIDKFEERYLELSNQQVMDLNRQKDSLILELGKEVQKALAELGTAQSAISTRVTEEVTRISLAGADNIKALQQVISDSGALQDLIETAAASDSFAEKLKRVDDIVNQFDNRGAATPVVAPAQGAGNAPTATVVQSPIIMSVPTLYKPVQYAQEKGELQPVIRYFDTTIPFTSRLAELKEKMQKLEEEKGWIFHEKFEDILTMVLEDMNPYMIGPSGCGKTFLVDQISELIGLPYCDIGYINEEYDLIGYKTATGDYSKTNFYDAYKFGFPAFGDELDNGNSVATVKLNSFLTGLGEGKYCFPNGERVEKHPNFRFIGAGNTTGNGATAEFNTRQKIEESVQQRLTPIFMGYDNRIEAKILEDYPEWLDLVIRFREITDKYADHNEMYSAPGIITTRDAEIIKRLLTNKSYGVGDEATDKIIKYLFIGTKDDDYLEFIKNEFESTNDNVKSYKLIKSFIQQAEQTKKGRR